MIKNLGIIANQLHTFILLIRPVIIAFGIAYVLNRPMIYIEQQLKNLSRKLLRKELSLGANRWITILILFILVLGVIMLLFNSIIPPIMTNLRLLLESLPMFGESINDYIKELGPYV